MVQSLYPYRCSEKWPTFSYNLNSIGMGNDGAMKYIKNGGTMERPNECPDSIHNLMRTCWRQLPEDRPTFIDICTFFPIFQTLTARRSLGAKSNEGLFSICAKTMKSRKFPMEFATIGYPCSAIWFRFLFFFEYVQQAIIKVEYWNIMRLGQFSLNWDLILLSIGWILTFTLLPISALMYCNAYSLGCW